MIDALTFHLQRKKNSDQEKTQIQVYIACTHTKKDRSTSSQKMVRNDHYNCSHTGLNV